MPYQLVATQATTPSIAAKVARHKKSAAQEIAATVSTLYFHLKRDYSEDLIHRSVRVLQFISMFDGQPRIDDVRQYLALSPNAASEMVKQLASKGLVDRNRSTSDERVVELALTIKGKQMLKEQTEMDVTKLSACLKALKAEDAHALVEGLRALLVEAQGLSEKK
jgi:DNA-binding MarR family transcriptional regulator